MQHCVPVETPIGVLAGRDAIRLAESRLPSEYGGTLTLIGEIDGRFCSRSTASAKWNYTISFSMVQGVRVAAFEFCDHPDSAASFEEVIESGWLTDIRGAGSPNHLPADPAHYRFWTNDDVFEIVCAREFILELTPVLESPSNL